MNSRTIETSISTSLLGQGIAPLLHTLGELHGNEFIAEVELPWKTQLIPVKLTIRSEEQEVHKQEVNGKEQ